jgi:hypothetical protein
VSASFGETPRENLRKKVAILRAAPEKESWNVFVKTYHLRETEDNLAARVVLAEKHAMKETRAVLYSKWALIAAAFATLISLILAAFEITERIP